MTHTRFIEGAVLALLLVAAFPGSAAAESEPRHPDNYWIQADGPLAPGSASNPWNLTRATLDSEYPLVRDALDRPGEMIAVPDDGTLDAFWDAYEGHDGLQVDGAVYRLALAMASPTAPPADGGKASAGEGVIAKERAPEEPADDPWVTTLEELDSHYPAIGRAVRTPNELTGISEEEREQVQAFLDHMSRNEYGALEVAGTQFDVALAMAGAPSPEAGEPGFDVPAAGASVLLGALGAAAVAVTRRTT